MTHTPGPWTIEQCADGQPLVTTGKRPGGYCEAVAVITRHATHARMAGISITPEATEANARLIAAAPALLAALETLAAYDEHRPPKGCNVDAWRGAIRSARTAIAQAKGEDR